MNIVREIEQILDSTLSLHHYLAWHPPDCHPDADVDAARTRRLGLAVNLQGICRSGRVLPIPIEMPECSISSGGSCGCGRSWNASKLSVNAAALWENLRPSTASQSKSPTLFSRFYTKLVSIPHIIQRIRAIDAHGTVNLSWIPSRREPRTTNRHVTYQNVNQILEIYSSICNMTQ
jgi:hypothetical protein